MSKLASALILALFVSLLTFAASFAEVPRSEFAPAITEAR